MKKQIQVCFTMLLLSGLIACGGDSSQEVEPPPEPVNPPPIINVVNTPPTISVVNTPAVIGSLYRAPITIADPDGDTLNLTLSNQPAWLALDQENAWLYGTPLANDEGNYVAISLVVSDGIDQVEHLFDIEVIKPEPEPVNPPPIINVVNTPPTISIVNTPAVIGSQYRAPITIADPDGDTLNLTLSNQPAWLALDQQNAWLYGTPSANDEGIYVAISLVVNDGVDQVEHLFDIEVIKPESPASESAILPDSLILNVGDIDNDGADETLVLTKRSIRSATGHKLMTWDSNNGYQEITPPEVRTYRGYVQDDPDMRVNANIEPGNTTMNANLSDGHNINIRLTAVPVTISGPEGTADPGTGNLVVPLVPDRIAPTVNNYIVPVHNMRRLDYAITLGNDYYVAQGNSVEAAVARVEQRYNDADFFYARDMGLAHEIGWMVVNLEENTTNWGKEWTNIHQPNGAVYQVRARLESGGGASASGDLFLGNAKHSVGSSLATYSKSLGHELGHTLGAGHYSSWGDIMSGSGSAIGSGTVERMIGNAHVGTQAQSPALTYSSPLPPFAMEDGVTMVMDTTLDIDVLENDYDGNGDVISISYVDAVTKKGGTATLVAGKVRYTPPAHWQGVDEFAYHVQDATGIANRQGYVKVAVHNNGLATHILFDETSGTTVHDIGPFQAHGQLTNGLDFDGTSSGGSVLGVVGNALERNVDGNSSAKETKTSADFLGIGDPLDGNLSVSMWVKYQSEAPTVAGPIIAKGGAVIRSRFGNPRGGWDIGHTADGRFRFEGNLNRDSQYTYANPQFDLEADSAIQKDTWYHLVMVMDRPNHLLRAWVNGQEISTTTFGTYIADGLIDNSHSPLVVYDSVKQQAQNIDTPMTVDDVRIYHKVLSPMEVLDLYSNPMADVAAGAPSPANGELNIQSGTTLNWFGGKPSGYQFDVYFGTSYQSVNNATTASLEYQGRQAETSFTPAISGNTRYYWRIDVIADSGEIKGDIWWFDA